MPTLQDLEDEKNATLAVLQDQFTAALTARNAAAPGSAAADWWSDAADQIEAKRDDFLHQTFVRQNNSDEIKKAIDDLRAATDDMKKAADAMKKATEAISGLADLLGAVDQAIGALQ